MNRQSGVIEFDIVVPTSKGAVYACRFACSTEVVAASTEEGMKINMIVVHLSFGHRNENSVCKTAWELCWVLTCDTMQVCKQCAKSKAKQKNLKKTTVAKEASVPSQRLYLNPSKRNIK